MAMTANYALHTLLIIGIIFIFTTGIASKRLCGKELADTLQKICKNKYNGFGRLAAPYPEDTTAQLVGTIGGPPFISKLTGGVLSPRVRRRRSGVSDECCKKACTYRELSNYCDG